MKCPKCMHIQENEVECGSCGIIFEKYYRFLTKKKFDEAEELYKGNEYRAALEIFRSILNAKIPKDEAVIEKCNLYITEIEESLAVKNENISVEAETASENQQEIEQVAMYTNNVTGTPKSSGLRSFGIILIIVGIVWGIIAFNMEVSVRTESKTIGSGIFTTFIPSTKVNNIGLMDDRRNQILISAVILICGVILFGFGTIKNAPTPETHLRCPDCKELVLKEARVCKHCGCKLVPQT